MRIVLDVICVIALAAAIVYFGSSIKSSVPAVYWSVTKDTCARIEVANSIVSCSKLSSYDRYELIYVE